MIPEEKFFEAKILIVDDEPDNIKVLTRILNLAGYKYLESTSDPRNVISIYKSFLPDLVLLDLKMPHFDGYQVMEQIKEIKNDSYISVLVLSALQDEESRLRALKTGARDFLNKPFGMSEVLARIRNLLEVQLLQKQLKNQNQRLEDEVRIRTKELCDTQLEVVRRLGMAAEYRDNETGLHIIRMSKMCESMGKATGMNAAESDLFLNASPMHDIGKIGVPDSILLKPAKLDPDEWVIMKTHTTIGTKLLSGHSSELMELASVIARTHHERWDGSGYPGSLKGEDIPLVGRICSICDVFDALTSKRPYKKPWSIKDALAEIYNGKGKYFDPELVEVFKKIESDIIKIVKEYPEKN